MTELERVLADVADLDHARAAAREEAASEVREGLFDDIATLKDPAIAARVVGPLVAAIATPRAAGPAAALVLEIVAAARRAGLDAVIAAASSLDPTHAASLDPPIRAAVRAAVEIRDGGAAPDDEVLMALCEDSTQCVPPLDPPTAAEVHAWARGEPIVGDRVAHAAVPLLVDVAFGAGSELEAPTPDAIARQRADTTASGILDRAHRTIFHAVLAWRHGRAAAIPEHFPAHREEERALAQWVIAAAGRDRVIVARLLTMIGCTTVDAVRAREAAHEMGEAIEMPDGDQI